jgi:hypothetical protein
MMQLIPLRLYTDLSKTSLRLYTIFQIPSANQTLKASPINTYKGDQIVASLVYIRNIINIAIHALCACILTIHLFPVYSRPCQIPASASTTRTATASLAIHVEHSVLERSLWFIIQTLIQHDVPRSENRGRVARHSQPK